MSAPTFQIPDKKNFIRNFLIPLRNYSESVRLKVQSDRIICVSSDAETGSALYAKYLTGDANSAEHLVDFILCIRNISKLLFFLENISDDAPIFYFYDNYIQYKSKETSLRMALMDEKHLAISALSESQFLELEMDIEFEITQEKMRKIMDFSFMANDSKKIYFKEADGIVYASFTDRSIEMSDEVSISIGETKHQFTEFGLVFSNFKKKIDTSKPLIIFQYREADGVVKITCIDDKSELIYIISSTTN